jgi:putative ABC transport system substrate-binding protein
VKVRWLGYLIAGMLIVSWPGQGHSQVTARVPRIGILTLSAGPNESIIESFRGGLRKFGYVEGRNIRLEHKFAEGHAERLPQLARELANLKVDAIVTGGGPTIRAALEASTAIPVVAVVHEADPAASGLIESYRRPGTNVTGIYAGELEAVGKRLELMKEVFPELKHVAVLWDQYTRFKLEELKAAAQSQGVVLHLIEVNAPYDFEGVFRTAKREGAHAAMVLLTYAFYVRRKELASAALKERMPTMHEKDDLVKVGGFMSYGASFDDTWGRAAYFVDRILRGAKPMDLPVEQVSTFRLTVNRKTATALGVSIPQSVLMRAEEVTQ